MRHSLHPGLETPPLLLQPAQFFGMHSLHLSQAPPGLLILILNPIDLPLGLQQLCLESVDLLSLEGLQMMGVLELLGLFTLLGDLFEQEAVLGD